METARDSEPGRVGVLVADSSAFIKGAPLHKWSSEVVTVREVIAEIRDKPTRERLQVLPYQLSFREPSAEALHHVTQFAKRTGDYGSLSAVDLRLISLTYQLHCEQEPAAESQLRNDPPKQIAAEEGAGATNTVGSYTPSKKQKERDSRGESSNNITGDNSVCDRSTTNGEEISLKCKELTLEEDGCEEVYQTESGDGEEEVDSDNEGWITPENFQRVCEEMGGVLDELPQSLAVGCITTDFAMQNVLLQMGLNLISTDGKRIRQLRMYAKKCKGCFRITTDTGLVWCPWCGNRSLYRVSVVVDSRGTMQYRALSNKQFSHKGLRHPLPIPKSGRHSRNPVLAPDQQVTYRERRRRENKLDPLDLDYIVHSSPFAVHDVTSRGARLAMGAGGRGGAGYHRRNPNSVQSKGRRKK